MSWEKAEIMFPEGVVPVENTQCSIEELRIANPPYTTTTLTKFMRNDVESIERLIWYEDGTFKRYKEYNIKFDESRLPDSQSALNTYGQAIVKQTILSKNYKSSFIEQTPYPPKKIPWWKKLFKRNK